MKFLKILAIALCVCMLGSAFIACDKGGDAAETTGSAETTVTITVNLIIKNGSETKYQGSTSCKGTLGDAIEMFCAAEGFEGDAFTETGLLSTIGELTAADGKSWIAYYEDQGQSKAFSSIKDQTLEDGKTVVIVLQ